MSGYALGQTHPTPEHEICMTGHCDYGVWGANACQAAWALIDAAGGLTTFCSPAPASVPQAPQVSAPSTQPVTETIAPTPAPTTTVAPITEAAPVALGPSGCPIEYPRGHWDQYGQLICERPRGLELIPVPVAYGAERVEIPRHEAAYTATTLPSAPDVLAPITTGPSDAAGYTITPPASTGPAGADGMAAKLAGLPPWSLWAGGGALALLAARGLFAGRGGQA